MNDPLYKLRARAASIRVYTGPITSEDILGHLQRTALNVINHGSEEDLRHYMEYATDAEVVCLLSELSLRAPLNSIAYKVYMHLFRKIRREMGQTTPDDIAGPEFDQPLDHSHQYLLNTLKRKLRSQQGRGAQAPNGND